MVDIQIKKLKGKNKKGIYIYIRKKGHKGAYYKHRTDVPIDVYRQYYKDKHITKKPKGTPRQYHVLHFPLLFLDSH